jgi:hypothetical protein
MRLLLKLLAMLYLATACLCHAQPVLWNGNFTNSSWLNAWSSQLGPAGKHGIMFGSANITQVTDVTAPGGGYLRIVYPAGSYAPSGSPLAPIGGCQFYGGLLHTNGNTPRDALTLQYSLRFPAGFNFVNGGKLPGLYGGVGNTGTDYPNGTDGFTTRHMWRQNGAGEAYPFLPNSPTIYGSSLGRGNWYFSGDGQWHALRQDVVLNDVGSSNGLIRVWYDGAMVLEAPGLFFRTTNSLQIEGILFQTFFGGGDTSYATPVTTYADFAGFSVSDLSQIGSVTLRSNYQSVVLAQAPAYYFTLDSSLADGIGNSVLLTVNGSTGGFANDYFNNTNSSRFFSATSDGLLTSTDLVSGGTGSSKGSISLLLRALDSTNNTGQRFVFSQGNTTSSANAFGLFFENNTSTSDQNALKFRTGNTTTTILPADQIVPGQWYYFAATWDETRNTGEVKWYLGQLAGPLASGTVNITDTAVIGDGGTVYLGNRDGLNSGFRNPGNGRIDEVAFWNRELTAAEITNQFNAVLPIIPPLPQLAITRANQTIVLSWATNSTPGLVLESASSLDPFAPWTFLGYPQISGTQYVFTNAISGPARLYRLNNP